MSLTYSDDLDAINTYFRTKPIPPLAGGKTNVEAFQIKDAFIRWYDALGWADQSLTGQKVYDEARTRRNQFDLALAVTPEAKEQVRNVITTGITSEEMRGNERPAVDGATGRVGSQIQKPTVAPTPSAMPDTGTPAPATVVKRATLSIGSRGPDVDTWQKFVGISPTTGYYGDSTAGKTKNWQANWNKNHPADKITVDGKVGPQTWARAFPQDTAPAAAAIPFAPAPSLKNDPAFAPIGPGGTQKKTAAKPAAQPAAPASKAAQAATATKKALVNQAGMLNITKWPLWAKVGAGVTVVGGIVAASFGHHKNPRRYGRTY